MKLSHIAWNLSGLSLPLLVAAITVPTLVSQIGQERFGILALAWGLIGYAGALDLGIGRALTQHVGKLIGKKDLDSIAAVLATASRITLFTGLIGSAIIICATLLGAAAWVKTTNIPISEIKICLFLLAIALPAQAMSSTYRGLNEAYLNFKAISMLRAGLGMVNFGGPFLISLYSNKLSWIIGSLVLSRLAALLVYRSLAMNCLAKYPADSFRYSTAIVRSLFRFGGWLTISSIISPILLQADRFIIASTISAAAVFVYVLPYEMVVQSLVLVGAISSVIFPSLTRLLHEKPDEWRSYFKTWLIRVACVMGIVCVLMAIALPFILPLWLKKNLDQDSVLVGQILCIGVFANSLAAMFYALLHAQGRSSATAKLHILELPLFLVVLAFVTPMFGVIGAACAWVGRMAFDSLALAWIAQRKNG